MGIGALFEHENHRGTGLKLIADRFLLLIVRKMLDVTIFYKQAVGAPILLFPAFSSVFLPLLDKGWIKVG